MDPSIAWQALQGSRTSPDKLVAPAVEGVYAIFVTPPGSLPIEEVPSSSLVYIGRSGNLAEREFETHFKTGASGFSTLRRSVGALLKPHLELMAVPRGSGSSDSSYRNYRFTDDGEKALSSWMDAHLEVGVAATPASSSQVEDDLISRLQPALCLKGWPNPQAVTIKALRAECVAEARRSKRN